MKYETPNMEVELLEMDDVITSSDEDEPWGEIF